MSLFGDDAPETPTRRQKTSSSLFNESPSRGANLFSENDNDEGESPWSFPTPKRAARSTLVKNLLKPDDVPELYVDVFDKLSEESDGQGVDVGALRRLVRLAQVDEETSTKIEKAVVTDEKGALSRGEIWVLLALIGLAQEGEEELTLDAVDERRKNLPTPKLGQYTPKKINRAPPKAPSPEPEAVSAGSQGSDTARDPPSPNKQTRPTARQTYGFPDTDPWSSPDLHKGHNHSVTNGMSTSSLPVAPAAATQRTTSAFTTHSDTEEPVVAKSPAASRQNTANTDGWGSGFNNDGPVDTHAEYGDGPRNSGLPSEIAATFAVPRVTPNGPEEIITVTTLTELEGMLFFQHRNYQVTSARRGSKVIRRYSDFVWLLDCLHKRYPFRQLPLLPPKRVAINGNYLAADSSFVEKRRRGLARFANALVRHPVLSQEQLVVMFLTVPTELAVWRKQASISVQEEFIGKSLPSTLEDSLPQNLQQLFDRVRTGVKRSAEQYINICNNIERMVKRNEGVAAEYTRISTSLQTLTTVSSDTYAADSGDLLGLNIGLGSVANHYTQSQSLLEDEARAWDEGVLEDMKRQRDGLVSIRDMFDRKDRYDTDNVPQLLKRIKQNEEKLVNIRGKPAEQVKPGEAERVEDAIQKDKQAIVDAHARSVFIKECIHHEILHFQNSQYHVSRLHQDWAAERVKYAELQAENWRALSDEVERMPVGGDS